MSNYDPSGMLHPYSLQTTKILEFILKINNYVVFFIIVYYIKRENQSCLCSRAVEW